MGGTPSPRTLARRTKPHTLRSAGEHERSMAGQRAGITGRARSRHISALKRNPSSFHLQVATRSESSHHISSSASYLVAWKGRPSRPVLRGNPWLDPIAQGHVSKLSASNASSTSLPIPRTHEFYERYTTPPQGNHITGDFPCQSCDVVAGMHPHNTPRVLRPKRITEGTNSCYCPKLEFPQERRTIS